MSLKTLRLDDLTFQNIVDELKSRIPRYCPEWTDHNVSDPGVTLIELFAYMAEQLLYRMNQMPALHYWKFVHFLGIPLPTPQPARVPITFWLTKTLEAAADNEGDLFVPIPAGATSVATMRTETQEPSLFLVERDAKIVAPRLVNARRESRDGTERLLSVAELTRCEEGMGYDLFSAQPRVGDCFVFYFDNDVSDHVLQFHFDLEEKQGRNIRIEQPPIGWEAYVENGVWRKIEDVEDGTKGLNVSGHVRLHLPKLARLTDRPGAGNRYALRVRVERAEYARSPHLLCIRQVATLGMTVEAAYLTSAGRELLGVSDGSPGQRFRLTQAPIILPLAAGETLHVEGNDSDWNYVDSFVWPQRTEDGGVVPPEKCFMIDVITNELCLPPAIRRANGEIVTYGAIPARGAELFFTKYRFGGGVIDLPRGAINTLTSSIPYIDRIENRQAVLGGQQEILETDALRMEVQRYLRVGSRERLHRVVTAEEYESLVLSSFPEEVGKVECRLENLERPNRPQMVVYVTAKIPVSGLLSGKSNFSVTEDVIARIDRLLYEHRLLTVRARASNPRFVPVDVAVNLAGAQNAMLEDRIQTAVAAYLNPLYGGAEGLGWPLEQLCTKNEMEQWLNKTYPEPKTHAVEIIAKDALHLLTIEEKQRSAIVVALNQGEVPTGLVDGLRKAGKRMDGQCTVAVRAPGVEWKITAGAEQYVVRGDHTSTAEGALNVYDFSDNPPDARLYILRSCRINFE